MASRTCAGRRTGAPGHNCASRAKPHGSRMGSKIGGRRGRRTSTGSRRVARARALEEVICMVR